MLSHHWIVIRDGKPETTGNLEKAGKQTPHKKTSREALLSGSVSSLSFLVILVWQ
jgi:hypothetical protein